jgi:flavin reductase (DIM6/NTAB) family NADH-FMN oxidoreductase RutF
MAIEKDLFRQVMGNFAAGVTVVTTVGPDRQPLGLTATAFTSLSLVPPLVLVCIGKASETYPCFEPAGIFAVNFLAASQQDVSQRFASSGGDKFTTLAWRRGVLGLPVLEGTIGHLECRIVNVHDGGDHTIYVGEVEAAASGSGDPLVYFRGAYRTIG